LVALVTLTAMACGSRDAGSRIDGAARDAEIVDAALDAALVDAVADALPAIACLPDWPAELVEPLDPPLDIEPRIA